MTGCLLAIFLPFQMLVRVTLLGGLAPTHLALGIAVIGLDGSGALLNPFHIISDDLGNLEVTFPSLVHVPNDCTVGPNFGHLAFEGQRCHFENSAKLPICVLWAQFWS